MQIHTQHDYKPNPTFVSYLIPIVGFLTVSRIEAEKKLCGPRFNNEAIHGQRHKEMEGSDRNK